MRFGIREFVLLGILLAMPLSSYWLVFRPQNQEIEQAERTVDVHVVGPLGLGDAAWDGGDRGLVEHPVDAVDPTRLGAGRALGQHGLGHIADGRLRRARPAQKAKGDIAGAARQIQDRHQRRWLQQYATLVRILR